jgi:transcriptional regulator with XRE-family HTH domain
MIDYAQKYKTLRQHFGLSQSEFAFKTGTSRSIISQIEIGKLKPSLENIASTSRAFNVSLNYFFKSNENLSEANYLRFNFVTADIVQEPVTISLQGGHKSNLLFVPVKERSNYITGLGNPEYIKQLKHYNVPDCTIGNYRMFEVEGHSMRPTLNSGDYVIGERITNLSGIKINSIYIIVSLSKGVVIERALNIILDGKDESYKLQLAGDNTDKATYPIMDIAPSDIAEVWQFHMLITKLPSGPDYTLGRLSNLECKVENIRQQLGKK